MDTIIAGIDWLWAYITGYPWIWTAIVVSSWAAHLLTQWIKRVRREMCRKARATTLEAYSCLLCFGFSSFAFGQSPHIAGHDQALFLGGMVGLLHAVLIKLSFAAANRYAPTFAQALDGEVYVDDPTLMHTVIGAVAGTKVKRDARKRDESGVVRRRATDQCRRADDVTEVS